MKRYFTKEQIAQQREKIRTVAPKMGRLLLKYVAHSFTQPKAREYATHGFARRIQTLARCIQNVFRIIPPGAIKIPSKARLHDAQINIQGAIGNAYGCVDNLAWIWVHERGIAVNRRQVGLRRHNKEVRNTFSREFHSYLESLDSWFEYLVDYRDALAHRVPLYIPPGGARPKDHEQFRDLERQMTAALNASEPYKYQRLHAEQMKLLIFQPLICHSFTEMGAPYVFHPQLIADFLTIEQLGEKMSAELLASRGQ